jgi:hypothetical protein
MPHHRSLAELLSQLTPKGEVRITVSLREYQHGKPDRLHEIFLSVNELDDYSVIPERIATACLIIRGWLGVKERKVG